jgi:hypothetical protein
MRISTAVVLALAIGAASSAVLAQQVVEPDQLKVSPLKYRGSYIKVMDVYLHGRAGEPVRMQEAGYPLDQWITFGLGRAGIRCFIRRDSTAEALVGGLQPRDQITVIGTLKEPRVRFNGPRDTLKLQPIIEVSKIVKGWGEIPPPPPPPPAAPAAK